MSTEAGTGARVPVIAVDGPSGAGKGTVTQALAEKLGWHLLDSGALYRATALAALERDIPLDAAAALADCARGLDLEFRPDPVPGRPAAVWLAGRDVSAGLRSEACGEAASRVAAVGAVREALLERQRAFARPPGLVADGRDMGTRVFPAATLKVFLTASPEERARRRYKQLRDKGLSVSLADLSRDIAERDRRDASRPIAPLIPAEDARVLDTTRLSVEQVVGEILGWVEERVAVRRRP